MGGRRIVMAIAAVSAFAAGCEQRVAGPEVTRPSSLAADPRRTQSIIPDSLLDTAQLLRTDLATLKNVLPSPGLSTPPSLIAIRGAIEPTEASLDFLVTLAGRLTTADHVGALNFLRAMLETLEQFKDKMTKALAGDDVSDAIRHAAAPAIGTADSLQSLIIVVLGCRSSTDC